MENRKPADEEGNRRSKDLLIVNSRKNEREGKFGGRHDSSGDDVERTTEIELKVESTEQRPFMNT